jgi:hypothetical protein
MKMKWDLLVGDERCPTLKEALCTIALAKSQRRTVVLIARIPEADVFLKHPKPWWHCLLGLHLADYYDLKSGSPVELLARELAKQDYALTLAWADYDSEGILESPLGLWARIKLDYAP